MEAVRAALARDPRIGAQPDEQGLTPLMCSLYYRQPAITQVLLESGVPVNVFEACALGDLERVNEHLSRNSDLLERYSVDGWTPLHLAAFFGRFEVAARLLDAGADATRRSSNGLNNQPLHAAVAGGSGGVAKLLVERGAPVNTRQHGGWTPLMGASANGDSATVRLLLAAGADPHVRADNGQSAVDLALAKGHSEIVGLLEMPGA